MWKRLKKASFTVETACVMPVILLTLFGLLYLFFFVHNRSWLTAASYEAALCGSMEGFQEDGAVYDTAQERSRMLGNTGFFGAENLRTSTSAGNTVLVTYDLDTLAGFGMSWHLHVEGEVEVIKPVSWIRKVKPVSELLEGFGDGE